MFEKCLAWRAKWNADTILEGWVFPQEEALQQEYAHAFFGCDKIGRPIYFDKAGYVLIDRLLKVVDEEALTRQMIHMYEDMLKIKFMACSELYDR